MARDRSVAAACPPRARRVPAASPPRHRRLAGRCGLELAVAEVATVSETFDDFFYPLKSSTRHRVRLAKKDHYSRLRDETNSEVRG